VGFGIARVKLERRAITGLGFRQLALVAKDIAKVIVRIGEIRLEADRRAQAGFSLFQLALLTQDIAEVAVRRGEIRHQAKCLANVLHRQVVAASLHRKKAEQMPGIGLTGIRLQNAAVEALRQAQLAGLMMAYRLVHSLGKVGHENEIISNEF
jgi:hypothetical protein